MNFNMAWTQFLQHIMIKVSVSLTTKVTRFEIKTILKIRVVNKSMGLLRSSVR